MDYNAAEAHCHAIGYNMAKVHGKNKNSYFAEILQSVTVDSAWIKPYIGTCMRIYTMPFLVYHVLFNIRAGVLYRI